MAGRQSDLRLEGKVDMAYMGWTGSVNRRNDWFGNDRNKVSRQTVALQLEVGKESGGKDETDKGVRVPDECIEENAGACRRRRPRKRGKREIDRGRMGPDAVASNVCDGEEIRGGRGKWRTCEW